jgi:hypothetical protein
VLAPGLMADSGLRVPAAVHQTQVSGQSLLGPGAGHPLRSQAEKRRWPDSNGDSNSSSQRQPSATGDSAQRSQDPRQLGICPAPKSGRSAREHRAGRLCRWGGAVQQQSTATSPDNRQPARPPAHRVGWTTAKRPAAPLVRDEEAAVPAACPNGEATADSHGLSGSKEA